MTAQWRTVCRSRAGPHQMPTAGNCPPMSENGNEDQPLVDLSQVARETPQDSIAAERESTGDGPEGDTVPGDDAQ